MGALLLLVILPAHCCTLHRLGVALMLFCMR
jgi:hypothetical protein